MTSRAVHRASLVALAVAFAPGCFFCGGDDGAPERPPPVDTASMCVAPSLEHTREAPVARTPGSPAAAAGLEAHGAIVRILAGGSDITAGETCALFADGALACWGGVGGGETPAVAFEGAADAAVGGWHLCASRTDGSVACWGLNYEGEAGAPLPAGADDTYIDRPRTVEGVANAVAIAAGDFHSCVLRADGVVLCFGGDQPGGVLGRASVDERCGTYGCSHRPAPVEGLPPSITAIAAGGYHTCALGADRSVWCWGADDAGQLGDGGSALETAHSMPARVEGVSASAIAAGMSATCALDAEGSVTCWGYLGTGRSDSGATSTRPCCASTALENVCMPAPQAIAGLPRVTAIGVGKEHACALGDDGLVYCWGGNRAGQLGDGTFEPRAEPRAVPGVERATALAVGRLHTCALLSSGDLLCWGDDENGQLGAGDVDAWSCMSTGGTEFSCSNEPQRAAL